MLGGQEEVEVAVEVAVVVGGAAEAEAEAGDGAEGSKSRTMASRVKMESKVQNKSLILMASKKLALHDSEDLGAGGLLGWYEGNKDQWGTNECGQ